MDHIGGAAELAGDLNNSPSKLVISQSCLCKISSGKITFKIMVLMKKLEDAGRALPITLSRLDGFLTMDSSCCNTEPANMPPRNTLKMSQQKKSSAMRRSKALIDTCTVQIHFTLQMKATVREPCRARCRLRPSLPGQTHSRRFQDHICALNCKLKHCNSSCNVFWGHGGMAETFTV